MTIDHAGWALARLTAQRTASGHLCRAARIRPEATKRIVAKLESKLGPFCTDYDFGLALEAAEATQPGDFVRRADILEGQPAEQMQKKRCGSPDAGDVTVAEISTWTAQQKLEFANSGGTTKPNPALVPVRAERKDNP